MSSTSQQDGAGFSKHSAEFNGKKSEITQDFKDLSKITGALAGDAVHMIQENASHLQENAAQMYERGIKQAKGFEKGIEGRIQKNPIESLLIVAGVGLVLGALWNRR